MQATASPNGSSAMINQFLKTAPSKPIAILGTVASGESGGSTSNVVWQKEIPIVPMYCTDINLNIVLPVTLTLPAGGSATLSPFAPYSSYSHQLLLGGAPPWPSTELLAWYLDSNTDKINYDPAYPGLGDNAGYFASIVDTGPNPVVIGGAGSMNPGVTQTNSGTAAATYNLTWTFNVTMRLQRKRNAMYGCVPFGDSENRPEVNMQLNPLIGTRPESSLFVNATSGSTCVLNGQSTVTANYIVRYVDLAYPGASYTKPTNPVVALALQINANRLQGITATETYIQQTHRTAMGYTAIHHLLINGQLPIQSDYFGLWDDQEEQSARWQFDSTKNTFQEYFRDFHRKWGRYPLKGHYLTDFDRGDYPPIAGVTPYSAMMSPDQNYASLFGVPVTPAMTTVLRIPSSVALSTPYVRTYSFGLVTVPY